MVGGIWGNCNPANPRNRRRRPSILVERAGQRLLVDTSPDLRLQLLDAEVEGIDAVLFTHTHADHCHGIDDLRPLRYARESPIDAYADAETMQALTTRFDYAFESTRATGSFYAALLNDHIIEEGEPFEAAGFTCIAFRQEHGQTSSLGYRIGPIGYSPDAVEIDRTGFRALEGIKLWIVDCLRYDPHPSHAHFNLTMEWISRVKPERAVLTHMNHTLDYNDVAARCPVNVEPGYDGLVIEIPDEVC
jgi:phosphoribosyl 1,2-cyclic phosphate phosphodiesterase